MAKDFVRTVLLFIGLSTVVLCWSQPVQAQDTTTAYAQKTDFLAADDVLQIDFPQAADGAFFNIAWDQGGNRYFPTELMRARAGRHCYETRDLPGWAGRIMQVAVTLNVPFRVKEPTFADEIDMFLAAEPISPPTANALTGHTLFAWSWNTLIIIVFLLAGLLFYVFGKRPFATAVAFGFLVSWGVMDLRNAYDHLATIHEMEMNQQGTQGMLPISIKTFADQASEMIGRSTWWHGPLAGVNGSFLQYRLAEHPYAPDGSGRVPDLWITQGSGEGQVLFKRDPYYLSKKDHP